MQMLLWLSHPDDHLLDRYAFGHIDDERVLARLQEHLYICEQCRTEVEQAVKIGGALSAYARAPRCGPARLQSLARPR
jgi:anti-sigma factor ChrR (cupin superfamily)